jgi:hypothetical protein
MVLQSVLWAVPLQDAEDPADRMRSATELPIERGSVP